jgi:type II secretory pathway pseudopilin PulG
MVSIAIFAVLTAILVFNFDRQRQSDNVRRAAEQLVADLRLVQNNAMTGKTIGDTGETPAVPAGGYGLHIYLSQSNIEFPQYADSYQVFADRERWTGTFPCEALPNERYDRGFEPLLNSCLTDGSNDDVPVSGVARLPDGVIINSVTIDNVAVPISILDIAFQPPKPIPYVGFNDPVDGALIGRTTRIQLEHTTTHAQRLITIVGASGQISLTTP